MQKISRDRYLQRLIDRRENGMIKVITGIRRCGKSYLLFRLFCEYLTRSGVDPERIIQIPLDAENFEKLHDAKALGNYIRERITDEGMWYVMLDEVQFCPHFESVLNGLNRLENVDIYVTGSNSKFLSSDVLTEFRGRGDEVRVFPLSFAEYLPAHKAACGGGKNEAWADYCAYGGLPMILSRRTEEMKAGYLTGLCRELYLKDIENRHGLRGDSVMSALVNILASAVGALTNPKKLADTFASNGMPVSDKTVGAYLSYLTDAFFISRAERYDIKGKKVIASPFKYYFTDIGLRNARLNFRQQEENHLMENIIYNELLVRGFLVDVGIVEHAERNAEGKVVRKRLEVDFVCNQGSRRYYIQSAFAIPDEQKMRQEENSLMRIGDTFKKIIVVRGPTKVWRTEKGIVVMDILEFLLNPGSLDL